MENWSEQSRFSIQNLQELEESSTKILELIGTPGVVVFVGDLGAGKTTLIQHLCKVIGVEDHVTSPTFALAYIYQSAYVPVQHLDLYRIASIEEALQLGIEEYLAAPGWTFIEWPQIITDLLPIDCHMIEITNLGGEARKIVLLQRAVGDHVRS